MVIYGRYNIPNTIENTHETIYERFLRVFAWYWPVLSTHCTLWMFSSKQVSWSSQLYIFTFPFPEEAIQVPSWLKPTQESPSGVCCSPSRSICSTHFELKTSSLNWATSKTCNRWTQISNTYHDYVRYRNFIINNTNRRPMHSKSSTWILQPGRLECDKNEMGTDLTLWHNFWYVLF